MVLLHIFLAFSHISVCVFVVFFPCLFHPKTCLIFLSTTITICKDTKLYGNEGRRRWLRVWVIFVPLPRFFGDVYLRNIYRKIP